MGVLLEKSAGRLPAVEESGPVDWGGCRGVSHGSSAVVRVEGVVRWVRDDLAPGRLVLLASRASETSKAIEGRCLRKINEYLRMAFELCLVLPDS